MVDIIVEPVPGYKLADAKLVQDCHNVLARVFPEYTWIIGLDEEDLGGVMTIMCYEVNEAMLGFPNFGYVLKLSTVYPDIERKCVIMAAGEILERAGLSTGRNKDLLVKRVEGINHNKHPLI